MNYNDIHRNIRVVSDIHLEHYTEEPLFENIITPCSTDILCLLGDIGNPRQEIYESFIRWCVNNFITVLVIAGNHEYYNSTIDDTNILISNICNKNGAIFLNNLVYIYKNYAFIGTTLWSYVPNPAKKEVSNFLNDYKLIQGLTVDVTNQLHKNCVKFLIEKIEQYKNNYTIIVLTHHSPSLSGTSYPPYEQKITNFGFSSDQSELIKLVDLWMYGHTHYNHPGNVFYKFNKPLVSNQRGYVNRFSKNYNKNFVINLL